MLDEENTEDSVVACFRLSSEFSKDGDRILLAYKSHLLVRQFEKGVSDIELRRIMKQIAQTQEDDYDDPQEEVVEFEDKY
jgi:hypothetical protein